MKHKPSALFLMMIAQCMKYQREAQISIKEWIRGVKEGVLWD